MWVRGLKRKCALGHTHWIPRSHPMWVRGLKRAGNKTSDVFRVAPYVGAWIET